MVTRIWGRLACGWAMAFAALHFYWALGGSRGLAVSAGPLAAERPGWFVAVGLWGVGAVCLIGAALGRRLTGPRPRGTAGRLLTALGWCACAVLLVRGAVLQALLLTGAAGPAIQVSAEQRRWTLMLWNPWFLLGGLLFGLATWAFGRASSRDDTA
ncbi:MULTISPECIES: DUF3995 domain-containing protein [Streptomyces]|uniref:DUF3995 domain-containing protein n=1 Tax=Streptomyces ramulosus TaxID=47762 RepID=A0ABW1FMC8_9ACTN